MKEEISRILAMVQDGKINSEEATELINAMQEQEKEDARITPVNHESTYLDKALKIRISSENGDKVNVNLPLRLIKIGLKSGLSIASKIPESSKYVKDIETLDIDLITDAIENELEGQIVDITSSDGDIVSVVIE